MKLKHGRSIEQGLQTQVSGAPDNLQIFNPANQGLCPAIKPGLMGFILGL